MKFSTIFAGLLATLVIAAPAPAADQSEVVKRGFQAGGFNQFNTGLLHGSQFNVGNANNFAFQNLHIAYLAALNGFQNNVFSGLVVNQGLAFDPFDGIFNFVGGVGQNQHLRLDQLLGLQSALVLSWLGNAGLLNGVNFQGGVVPILDFGNLGGHISPRSQFNLGVDQVVTTQITSFVQNTGLFTGGNRF